MVQRPGWPAPDVRGGTTSPRSNALASLGKNLRSCCFRPLSYERVEVLAENRLLARERAPRIGLPGGKEIGPAFGERSAIEKEVFEDEGVDPRRAEAEEGVGR